MEGETSAQGGAASAADPGVRVTVDAAWSDDRQVLCYLEDPANPAAVTEQHEPYTPLPPHQFSPPPSSAF
jgi:hypothetical protein